MMVDYINLEKYCKNLSILLVEDDKHSAKKMKELLDDIFPVVHLAKDGEEGIKLFLEYYRDNKNYYDLIITDIQMPKLNGVELTKLILKENSKQEVIVLSAHNESNYLMELINLGISQFVLKPINYDNFIGVIYKITGEIYKLKNINEDNETSIIKLSDTLEWDRKIKVLRKEEKDIKLTKKEFLLIDLLLSIKDKTFTNEEILLKVWMDDDEKYPDISNLKNIISRFRKKVPDLNIENIYGYGYRINVI